jgi:type IV secretory pathway VirB10-like protein
MNRIFRFETAVKTGLIVTLALAIVFAAGCRKKEGEPTEVPPAPPSSEKKQHKRDAGIQTHAAEVNQDAAASPAAETKDTIKPSAEEAAQPAPGRENRLPQQANGPTVSAAADFKSYESMKSAEEKIDFISEYADEHPESAAVMVLDVLDDKDVDVRTAAMEILVMKELDDVNIVYVAAKALKDSEQQIRQSAVEVCTAVTDPAVGNVLVEAINDSSEEVRTAAAEVTNQKDAAVRLFVLKSAIVSQYEEIRESAFNSLVDASSPAAVDILIIGLKDSNPDIRDSVKSSLDFLFSQEFDTYDQAYIWWNANRNKYDDELNEKD